ncbi:arginine--tRNA ligase [Myxococcota bacterium]
MATVRQQLTERLETVLAALHERGVLDCQLPHVQLTPPKQAAHGDFATSVALALAKPLKKKPRDIAAQIQEALGTADGMLEKTEIAGPGFLNLFVARHTWHRALADMLAAGESFIRSHGGRGVRVLVEFVSANPTGPLHLAHGRGAVTGDVISRLLEAAGYEVEREYYVNDLGHQLDVLGRSIYLRYAELLGRSFEPPADFYPGDYVTDIAREIVDEVQERFIDQPEDEWLAELTARGTRWLLDRIRVDLDAFGVTFDNWVSEKELTERVGLQGVIDRLEQNDNVYSEDGKRWFKSTDFGDDKDRVVVREDGRPTYFASDIAYHDEKKSRGFDKLINVWGADHGGYVARVKAGLAALGHAAEDLDVIFIQMVSLSRAGEKLRMGKRSGTAIWLSDVIAEAGCDATRYFFVMRRSDAQLDFDIELATKKSLDNPVYYAQYGHARLCSIARRAAEAGIPEPEDGPNALDPLVLPEELALIKAMNRAPDIVADAARAREPHQVVYYIQETIAAFHSYFTQYKHTEKVISDDAGKTRARLLLCRALRDTLCGLLTILGVSAPERMLLEETEAEEA